MKESIKNSGRILYIWECHIMSFVIFLHLGNCDTLNASIFKYVSRNNIKCIPLDWISSLKIFSIANMLENVKILAILAITSNFDTKKVGKCQS